MSSLNLVLGLAFGYTEDHLLPFVASLRESGYEDDVVLFVDDKSNLGLLFKKFGIESVPIAMKYPFSPLFSDLAVANQGFLEKASPHILRYPLFRLYLMKNRKPWKNVLLTDVRDVYFQDDPFKYDFSNYDLSFVYEDQKIGDCRFNSKWILDKYGASALESLKECTVSCSGTTFGTRNGIEVYLNAMNDEIQERKIIEPGFDQGIHNFLLHTNKLKNVNVYSNFNGPVLTMSSVTLDQIPRNSIGKLLNVNGTPIPTLHQYDRHRSFCFKLECKYIGISGILRKFIARVFNKIKRTFALSVTA